MSSSQRSIATSTSSNSKSSSSSSSSTVVDASGRVLTGKYLEKASSKKDLVLRLRKILRVLRDDDNIEPDSDEYPGLAALCHSLTRYVNHRDKEVRLYTVAACMELFTVYAPEAPWDELETIDIFKQTIRQLANLAHSTGGDSRGKSSTDLNSTSSSSSGPHFYQYYRILELLAEVKIAVVLVDLSKKNDDISDDDNDDDSDITGSEDEDDYNVSNSDDDLNNNSKKRNSISSQNRRQKNTIAKRKKKNEAKSSINYEALQTLTELFRTLLQSVRNNHPSEIFDFCQKALTSCVEEFFESTILPIQIIDEILVCIGQGPHVLVLQHKQQKKVLQHISTDDNNNKKGRKGRNNKRTASAIVTTAHTAAVVYVQQNNPSYMVASAVVRATMERLSTPIASLLNGLVNSDPRSIDKSTILNHVVCENNEDHLDGNEKDNDNISEKVLEMSLNLGKPQRQQQDIHGTSNVYSVILELQRVAPAILTTVIGNLSSHVETLDADHRCLVVQTLGKLFAGSSSSGGSNGKSSSSGASNYNGNLTVAYQYNPCFRRWLTRSGDRIEDIRQIMLPHMIALAKAGSVLFRNAQSSSSLSSSSPEAELAREVQDALIARLTNDPSKMLILQVIQELCTISYHHRKVLSRNLLEHVGLKVLSKEKLERKNALTGLVQLYFRQYIKFHLSTVQEGGDDCPIEAVLQVLNDCCRPTNTIKAATSTTTATSLIAARCKESLSSSFLSPKKIPKKKKSVGKRKGGRSRRQARSPIVSDDNDYDDDDAYGSNLNRRNNDCYDDGDDDDDDDDFSYYQWIPCVLFESTSYTDTVDSEMRSRVVQLMDELLLGSSSPHPDNHRHLTSTARATGLAVVVDAVRNQSPSAWNGMMILQSLRAKLQKTLRAYLDAKADIRNHETGSEEHFVADAKAKDLLEKVSTMIPPLSGAPPVNGKLHVVLEKFHSMKDKHIFRILGTITKPSHSVKARARALDDLPKRVKSTAGDAVQTWVKSLAKRCAMGDLINHDIIHHCVLLAQECLHEEEFEATQKFLVCVQLAADLFPSLCAKEEIYENLTELFRECNSMTSSSSHQMKAIEQSSIMTTLSAILASVSPYRASSGRNASNLIEDDFHKKLITLCREGTPEQARHAVATMTALSKSTDCATLTQEQTDSSLPLLKTLATPSRLAIASVGLSTKLVCVLVALTELADHAPKVFESSSRGMNALKFALEMVLMGRAHLSSKNNDDDDDGNSSSDDETDIEETKTPKRGRKSKNVSSHLSPTTTDASLVEDENLSISCRTLCAAMELLATYIRSTVFTTKKMKSILPKESVDIIGKVFDILSQILRDQGMPPSSRDRELSNLRQDRAALRQCAAIHLFRLCDTRLGLDQKFLTTQRWHLLASSLLDDERVVRKSVMEELGLMLTGHEKYSTKLGMGTMAPRLRFVAMSVFCIDGSHGSHSRGNGNAANIGKSVRNQKGNINGCIEYLRKVYESSSAQYRAQGPQAEKQFETFTKLTIMPEYAVPYAYHLLTYRHETPSNTAGGKANDDEEFEIDEGGQKVLKKRLKALYDPLVLQLGVSADNISFLLRMAEMLAKSFQPIGSSSVGSGNDNGKKEREKLTNICATAREVLLSYVKTDVNLDTHPGAIHMPGNLFRRLENRKRAAKALSSSTTGSPILDVMMQNEDNDLSEDKKDSRKAQRRSGAKSLDDSNQKMRPTKHHSESDDAILDKGIKKNSGKTSSRSTNLHEDSDSKSSVIHSNDRIKTHEDDTFDTPSNIDKTQKKQYDIGVSIKKNFDDKFYLGRITHYDHNNGFYKVKYEDGDEEELNHDEVTKYCINRTSKQYVDDDFKIASTGSNNEIQEDATSTNRKKPRRSTRSTKFDGDGDSNMSSTGSKDKLHEDEISDSRKAPRRYTRSIRSEEDNASKNDRTENGTNNFGSSQSSIGAESTITNHSDEVSTLEKETDKKVGKRKSSIRPETPKGSVADSHVHFSPEVDFGGMSPIGRRTSRGSGNDRTLLSSAETKTRGTTPPSDLRFTATASVVLGASPNPNTHSFGSPATVSASFTGNSSHGRRVKKPLGNKKKVVSSNSRSKGVTKKLAVNDKENPKKSKEQIPNQIKIVRSPKFKISSKVSKKTKNTHTRKRDGKKNTKTTVDSFDFDG